MEPYLSNLQWVTMLALIGAVAFEWFCGLRSTEPVDLQFFLAGHWPLFFIALAVVTANIQGEAVALAWAVIGCEVYITYEFSASRDVSRSMLLMIPWALNYFCALLTIITYRDSPEKAKLS